MKKLSLILFLLPIMVVGQTTDMCDLKDQYIKYCDELVTDTIIESGHLVKGKEVPVYGSCGEIIAYKQISSDTAWDGYECEKYKSEEQGAITFSNRYWAIDSISVPPGIWNHSVKTCTVPRKHVCHIKREKPTAEGFYQWLWKQL